MLRQGRKTCKAGAPLPNKPLSSLRLSPSLCDVSMYDAFYYSETTNPKLPAQASRQEELESRLHCKKLKNLSLAASAEVLQIALGERFFKLCSLCGH